MSFNSVDYFLFLWAAYVAWWTLQGRRPWRHAVLLLASWWFYGQAGWAFVSLLVASTLVDFVAGSRIHRALALGETRRADRWLGLSLAANLGMLGVFKYFDFLSASVETLLTGMGTEARTWQLGLILPAGISFYTFQSLSYSIDIRRGRLVPVRSFVDFAMYVAFFPQLIAGPIVRARQFLPQLVRAIPMTRERLSSGLFLILQGLAKKVLMADVLGRLVVDPIMNSPQALATLDVADVALLALGFALQLYGDFAGYSDVAIGSARLFGLELPRNFDSPLRATSLDAFWGRWHISLSTWFRDYVFMPLCGRRASFGRRQSALLATFVIIGLWHGAAFTFVAFGLVHGVGLCSVLAFRRIMPRTAFRSSIWWRGACLAATFGFVCLSSLLFRAATVDDFALVLAALGNWKLDGPVPSWPIGVVLAVGLATHFMPDAMTDRVERGWVRLPPLVQGACLAAALVLFLGLGPADSAPYIYFRF